MAPQCEIKFDNNPDGIYYAGQMMSGVAVMDVAVVLKARKIELKIQGYAECQWTESRDVKTSNGTRTEHISYRGLEWYINSVTLMAADETYIQPGRHTYNFMLQIPVTTPSSMNATYGNVIYKVILNLYRPWDFDVTFTQDFTVIYPVDINSDPSWMLPCSQEEIKRFCCCCCKSAPVIFTVKIPRTFFIPGEKIYVNATINNPTDVEISNLEFFIIKHVVYTSQTPESEKKSEVVKIFKEEFGEPFENGLKIYEYYIEIPQSTPATTVNPDFRVIRLSYELKISMMPSGFHFGNDVIIPIIIGTVPPPESIQMQPTAPQMPVHGLVHSPKLMPSAPVMGMPSAPLIPSNSNNAIHLDPDGPPPSFEEAMNMPRVGHGSVNNYNAARPLGFVFPGPSEKSEKNGF